MPVYVKSRPSELLSSMLKIKSVKDSQPAFQTYYGKSSPLNISRDSSEWLPEGQGKSGVISSQALQIYYLSQKQAKGKTISESMATGVQC